MYEIFTPIKSAKKKPNVIEYPLDIEFCVIKILKNGKRKGYLL